MTDSSDGELRRSIDRLNNTMEQLRTELVRKDVYESDERARAQALLGIADDVSGVAKDVAKTNKRIDDGEAKRAADRRLVIASFVAPFVLLILSLYIASQIGVGR